LHPPTPTLFPYTTLFRSRSRSGRTSRPRANSKWRTKIVWVLGARFIEPSRAAIRPPLLPLVLRLGLRNSLPLHVRRPVRPAALQDRKSTRLNSSHLVISY